MRSSTIATTLTLLSALALPVQGQTQAMSAGHGGMMGQGMMQMCHGMMMEGAGAHAMGQAMHGASMMEGGAAMHGPGGMASGTSGPSMMGMMHMMQAGGASPGALLAAGGRLGLSDAQKATLKRLADAATEEHQRHMKAAMDGHRDAAELLAAPNADLDTYAVRLGEAAQHMAQAHVARVRAFLEAGDVLTEAQRTQVREGMGLVGSMMCGMKGEAAHGDGVPEGHEEHHL